MNAALPQVSRDELCRMLESGDELVLIDALAPMAYAHSHLPGAINITPERVDDEARRRIPDSGTNVVVYCANAECESSVVVGERLLALGYRNVRHYAGGKEEWREANLPLEGRRAGGS